MLQKIDEHNYTSELKKAIDTEVSNLTKRNSSSAITPHSTKQKPKDFKLFSQCIDLYKVLPNYKILLLEIKTTIDLVNFKSYDYDQHRVYIEFYKYGIPINYCYNIKDDYSNRGDNIYTLNNSLTSSPDKVCDTKGVIQNKALHIPLAKLLNNLLRSSGDDKYYSEILSAFFTDGVIKNIEELNLSLLFIAFDPKTREIICLDKHDLIQISETFKQNLDVKSVNFDFIKNNSIEIKSYLENQSKKLTQAIHQYDMKIKKSQSSSFNIGM
jgi:hypothetical protein